MPNLDMNIASYTFEGTGPNGATFSSVAAAPTYTVSNLVQGSWSVTANGLNAAGTVIGTGTASVSVVTGQTATVNILVAPIVGNGTLTVALSWPAALVSIPQITEIVTTDTVYIPPEKRHPKLTVLSVAAVFGDAISRNYRRQSISDLFVYGEDS